MISYGIEALILEGNEAGGHIGPVSINVLVQEILPEVVNTPVFVAGGIGRGEIFLKFLELALPGAKLGLGWFVVKNRLLIRILKIFFYKIGS